MSVCLLEKIRTAENLPSLPAVAVEVLRLARSEDTSLSQIAEVIEKDPALTGRILRVANSPLFGMPRQICSLRRAILILGLRTVRVMALSFSLLDAVESACPADFDYRSFWRGSLASAVAAKLLAQRTGCEGPDEAFATALLSDVGILAALRCDLATYCRVLVECESSGRPLHLVEEEMLGASHELFSSYVLDAWGLPDAMVRAVSLHHRTADQIVEAEPNPHGLLRTLAAGATIGDSFRVSDGAASGEVRRAIGEVLPIKDADLDEVMDTLHDRVVEAARSWSIDIGDLRSCRELQAEAAVQLAELSVAAELERAQLAARAHELNNQNRRLAHQANTDGLTGIHNRTGLEHHLEEVFRDLVPQGRSVGLLLLDLDRFKLLNDTFGHQTGDEALRLVGRCLSDLSSDRLFVARYGGEEFAIVLLNTDSGELKRLGEQIRVHIQQISLPHRKGRITLSASIGAALVDGTCSQPSSGWLVALADQRLYQAKRSGRNRVICTGVQGGSREAASTLQVALPSR